MLRKDNSPAGGDLTLKKFAPAIFCFIVVLILICLPGDELPTSQSWMEFTFFDKWIHIIMFAFMTFLFLLPIEQSSLYQKQKRHYFIRIGLSASIWGLTTEFIQKFYCPTRSFDLLDWAADSIGVVVAIIYCKRFHRL